MEKHTAKTCSMNETLTPKKKHIARIYEQFQKHARFVLKPKKTNASTKTSKFVLGNTTTSGDDKKQKSIEMQK